MEGNTKKIIMITCLLAVAVVIFAFNNPFAKDKSGMPDELQVKCNNEQCGHTYNLNIKEYTKQSMQTGGGGPMGGAIICPKCGKGLMVGVLPKLEE